MVQLDKVLGRYSVTGKDFPDWMKEMMSSGKARVKTDFGDFECIMLFTPSGTLVAHMGDVFVKTNSSVFVLPKEKAKKYVTEKEASVNEKR